MNYSEEQNSGEFSGIDKFIIQEKSREIFVLDSSVIFKWFYSENESGTEAARILYEKATLKNFYILSPELLIYELLNIFRFRTNISEKLLEDIIREIFNILIFPKLDRKSYIMAYEISRKIKASIYDCIYIAMSEIYKAPLIAADKKLCESAKSLNFNIVFLDDFVSFKSKGN
ncbi:MAG: type II toxin-antitoxin system VapC family toxin [Actinomycetota bacterium]|nr:type II toxin-antitoxin system VapC family toxin [Actinomycetota bacterium]